MVDTVRLTHLFDKLSDQEYDCCNFPFRLNRKVNEDGEIVSQYFDWEEVKSPLTGAGFKVRAIPVDAHSPRRVAGYEVDINVPACLIGRNHLLVNGVPRAVEGVVELLKHFVAERNGSPLGISCFKPENCQLLSVSPTFLFKCDTPEEALSRLQELRDHADGVLNHNSRPASRNNVDGRPSCFVVGAEYFTLYTRLRGLTIVAYIKQPNVEKAFATFPNAEIQRRLEEEALRTVRVEVTVHKKWLEDNALDSPDAWRGKPQTYEKLFELARATLRLDENLRVRAPSEATIAKLSANCRSVLRDHLNGANIRQHELVLDCTGTVSQNMTAQNKKFSAFKLPILDVTAIDISIPWEVQRTKLSPHLKDWFRFPGEYVPSDDLQEHVFSRVSVPQAIATLQSMTEELLAKRYPTKRKGGISNAPVFPEEDSDDDEDYPDMVTG